MSDGSGNTVTSPTYIANVNPFRYRGYYYDTESGFYYLQSRYYDPTTGRFINADGQINTDSLLGTNLFAYCGNNTRNIGFCPIAFCKIWVFNQFLKKGIEVCTNTCILNG